MDRFEQFDSQSPVGLAWRNTQRQFLLCVIEFNSCRTTQGGFLRNVGMIAESMGLSFAQADEIACDSADWLLRKGYLAETDAESKGLCDCQDCSTMLVVTPEGATFAFMGDETL